MKNETIFPQIFPQGDRLPEEFSRYFTGQAYLASISNNEALGTHISNVTFERAAAITGTVTRAVSYCW